MTDQTKITRRTHDGEFGSFDTLHAEVAGVRLEVPVAIPWDEIRVHAEYLADRDAESGIHDYDGTLPFWHHRDRLVHEHEVAAREKIETAASLLAQYLQG